MTPDCAVTPAGTNRETGLALVERQERAVVVEEVPEGGEVPGDREDDAGVHHDGLDDHPGDLAPVRVEEPGDAGEVVELGDQREAGDRRGAARRGRGAWR